MSAYRTGFVAGIKPPIIIRSGKYCPLTLAPLKELVQPVCPYPAWRVFSAIMWHDGLHNGTVNRLTKGRANGR